MADTRSAETWTVYVCEGCGTLGPREQVDACTHWSTMKPVEVVPSSWKERAERAEAALKRLQADFDDCFRRGRDLTEAATERADKADDVAAEWKTVAEELAAAHRTAGVSNRVTLAGKALARFDRLAGCAPEEEER